MLVPPFRRLVPLLVAVATASVAGDSRAADVPAALASSGVAVVPADAAFLSATLRAREQVDRFRKSNAYAALRAIPAVKRALESMEEQRTMPGNPLAVVDTFLQLPENAQAADLVADMVATDTFVYGEPSCASFVLLTRKFSAVLQAAGAIGDGGGMFDVESDLFQDDETGGEAALRRPGRGIRCQVAVEDDELTAEARQKRLIVQTLVDNIDLVVVPDVVWGFRTTKLDAARTQLARLETLLTSAAGGDVTADRRKVAGGDFLVLTVAGESLPWGDIERELAADAGDIDGFDEVFAKLRSFDVCVALGILGDRVILSIGDSTEHLAKLAADAAAGRLLARPAMAPLLANADKPLTGISYLSADMVKALAQTADDMQGPFEAMVRQMDQAGLPDEAMEEVREESERFAVAMAGRLPVPGAWTAFSFLTDAGYEGYAWDWSTNQFVDGSRRLDILEHAGGAPLAVAVTRLKSDPKMLDEVTAFVGALSAIGVKHGPAAMEGEAGERAREFTKRFGPLAARLRDILRDKLLASLADGQMGYVLDGKSRTKKLQRDLPASADPLPLPEAAIVLPLKDSKLFREGLSDLFALGDDTVATVRELDPDVVPADYEVPDPEKTKVESGTVWSFPLPEAGLDEQLRPAIGVGEEAAVFALAPKQAARLLGAAKLETGAQLTTFEEPLASAAAIDVAGVVDALEPWLVYLTRYGCARERDGMVEADAELAADDETEQAREALKSLDVVLDVAKCLRAAVAETAFRDNALVTHWRNVIRDLPKAP